ncbi:MAG TPA: manganese efflux pump [Roseovarius sp.]|nr:manganese efflux pump [Roseovarius sp.]
MTDLTVRLLLIGIAIAANNTAVALALGSVAQRALWLRILVVFGAFEFTIPLVGAWLGQHVARLIAGHADWLGPLFLMSLGGMTIAGALRSPSGRKDIARFLTGWAGLVALAAGLSVDNLVVGFSMGLGGVPPLALATTILVCSVLFAWAGLALGRRARRNWGGLAGGISGMILIGLGITALMGWA